MNERRPNGAWRANPSLDEPTIIAASIHPIAQPVHEHVDEHGHGHGSPDGQTAEHDLADQLDEPYLVAYARWLSGELGWAATMWMARHGVGLVRLTIGVVFVWFGALKLIPGVSPAEGLVTSTADALAALVGLGTPDRLVIVALGLFEVGVGLAMVLDRRRQTVVALLLAHMACTALPLVLLPEIIWGEFPVSLTLEGQYIVKNVIIVAAATVVGATAHGGHLSWAPAAEIDPSSFAEPEPGPEPVPSGRTPVAEPQVWVVDRDGHLVSSFTLDGYYAGGAPVPAPSPARGRSYPPPIHRAT